MKAVIIGKNGQLAKELVNNCPYHIKSVAFGKNEIDLLDVDSIKYVFEIEKPDVIINASAYTAVDKAEKDKINAYLLNNDTVVNLGNVAKKLNIKLLHVSTDYVFDGVKSTPYKTSDKPNPINVYGASKLAGEQELKKIYPENSASVRTSWLYSCYGNNFVKNMLTLMSEKKSLNVVSDQIGSPTYAKGLSEYLWVLAEQDKLDTTYHYSDSGMASWYEFAVEIQNIAIRLKILNEKIPIFPVLTSQYPTDAKRPLYSLMEKENSPQILHWKIRLEEMMENLCKQ